MPPADAGGFKINPETVFFKIHIYYNEYMVNNKQENQDFLTAGLIKFGSFCKRRKQAVLTALGVLVVAAVLGAAYQNHNKRVEEASWADYYTAQVALLTAGQEQAFYLLNNLNQKYPGSNAAQYAQLLKADLLYSQENYAQAADIYKELHANAKNKEVAVVADLSLGAAYQAMKKYQDSIDVMNHFIAENPTSYALPQAYLTLALSQELAGQKDQAKETYKLVLENYTKSYFGTFAKDKLNDLKK